MNERARRLRELPMHLMLLPAVILTFIYSYIPIMGIAIAFKKYNPMVGFWDSPWIGFDNFKYLLELPGTFQILRNTVFIALLKIILNLIVPVVFALLLNEIRNMKAKKSIQTLVYLPHFLSWIIFGGILIDILSPSEGIINQVINALGFEPVFFLANEKVFPYVVILTDVWKEFGFAAVIYLAALTGVDPSLYEASIVDGANRWKQTLHITIPGILPIIVLMTVLGLGNVLNAGFEQIFVLYSPSVYSTGDIIDTFVYRIGMIDAQFGVATAVGLFKSVVAFVFVSVSYKLADKLLNYRIF